MLRNYFKSLNCDQRAEFARLLGSPVASIKNNYLSPDISRRKLPSRERLNDMVAAADVVTGGGLTREGLALYFYAAPDGSTGQERESAAA